MSTISAITENTWTLIIGQAVIVIGMIIKACVYAYNRVQDRKDRESKARILARGLRAVKLEGGRREKRLSNKLDETVSAVTDIKGAITSFDQLKAMTSLAKRLGSTDPVFYDVALPPQDYVPFDLAEGSAVYWKSEDCLTGRQVRYLVEGPCSMGFHFHRVVEIISGIRGTLFYEAEGKVVTINPGDTYTTPAESVHSARFEGPGEVVVHWPDQDTDNLEIGIWP